MPSPCRSPSCASSTASSRPSPTPSTATAKFLKDLKAAEKKTGTKLSAPIRKAVLAALSERDEEAQICRHKDGNPEPDPDLRDYENVPLGESINDYFAREVRKVERQIVRMLADVTGSQPGGTAA
jgi:type I restriction enzyme M protein